MAKPKCSWLTCCGGMLVVFLSFINIFGSHQVKNLGPLLQSFPEEWMFLPQLDISSPQCQCLHCNRDKDCGGLWAGRLAKSADDASTTTSDSIAALDSISLVISHCLHDLYWIHNLTYGIPVHNITIYSKCGKPVVGAPSHATVVKLPNVGRCDHTYAHHMANLPMNGSANDAILFLKDNRNDSNVRLPGTFRSLTDMLHILHHRGFACGIEPIWKRVKHRTQRRVLMSIYHDTNILLEFSKGMYTSQDLRYKKVRGAKTAFASGHDNFAAFVQTLNYSLPFNLTPVCYGGSFGTTREAIQKQPRRIWQALEEALSRGNNIEEGHFAERLWAGLLSKPLLDYQIEALQNCSGTNVLRVNNSVHGALYMPYAERYKECLMGGEEEGLPPPPRRAFRPSTTEGPKGRSIRRTAVTKKRMQHDSNLQLVVV